MELVSVANRCSRVYLAKARGESPGLLRSQGWLISRTAATSAFLLQPSCNVKITGHGSDVNALVERTKTPETGSAIRSRSHKQSVEVLELF